MLKDLKITDAADYNTALALYFLGYVLFEVPANIVLKKLNPRRWLPVLTVAWGITAALQGLIVDRNGFFAARFFMGVAEAGLFPGCIFVFSMFYKRNERHWRVAVFFGGAAIAGAFGGVLAWAIGHIKHFGSRPDWAAIFIIEGLVTILVGFNAFLFHGFAFPLYSLSLFLPTIISGLGFASWKAQLLTVPPYVLAFISILAVAYSSHKTNRRGLWIIIGGGVAIVGYIVLLATTTPGARYTGTFLCVMGIYSANGVLVYRPSLNANFFRTPHLIAVGYTIFGILVAAFLWIRMGRENSRRAVLQSGGEAGFVEREKEVIGGVRLGDRHPAYVYQL
ncbi:hypothetical protein RQP46_001189 [Phenoliferia psychrophenolica]